MNWIVTKKTTVNSICYFGLLHGCARASPHYWCEWNIKSCTPILLLVLAILFFLSVKLVGMLKPRIWIKMYSNLYSALDHINFWVALQMCEPAHTLPQKSLLKYYPNINKNDAIEISIHPSTTTTIVLSRGFLCVFYSLAKRRGWHICFFDDSLREIVFAMLIMTIPNIQKDNNNNTQKVRNNGNNTESKWIKNKRKQNKTGKYVDRMVLMNYVKFTASLSHDTSIIGSTIHRWEKWVYIKRAQANFLSVHSVKNGFLQNISARWSNQLTMGYCCNCWLARSTKRLTNI